MTVVLVALGAAVASVLRFLAGHHLDGRLPWGTITVNVFGSLLIGIVGGLELSSDATTILATGFCGGLTTYSAFAVRAHGLGPRRGALSVLLTLPPALLACWLGYAVAG